MRSWKRDNADTSASSRAARKRKWDSTFGIETEEEREAARKHPDAQKLVRDVREMNELVSTDPERFAKEYPALKQWMAAFPAEKPR